MDIIRDPSRGLRAGISIYSRFEPLDLGLIPDFFLPKGSCWGIRPTEQIRVLQRVPRIDTLDSPRMLCESPFPRIFFTVKFLQLNVSS